ncbi:ribonuclease HII [Ostreibacterium oceani]|uniref:Ribonuclease HII n=1 Tax=Ostreibacterium oceani TaxID=2654998 RepID=A0A6N7EWE8_9GAMM|nr:ribonuclease HII [Ostreibacterium oceani]MPV86233.1 ribonuclease HII [Ostreibacterium oceani]
MRLAGVDEAGRGALVGSVYAAAVVLPEQYDRRQTIDSKKMTEAKRFAAADYIKSIAVDFAVATATAAEIDALNIHHATLLAMQRAVLQLTGQIDAVWVDGKFSPELPQPTTAIIGGDGLHDCIAAASILAKTARDAEMKALDETYPQYGFAKHKGYATAAHREALAHYGALPMHRRSYKTVRDL